MVSEKIIHFQPCQIATSNSVKQHKLRKLVAMLSDKEGSGREFVSLYIPSEKSIDEVVAFLKEETDSAFKNSGTVRDRLQDTIKSVIQRLKLLKVIPENGLAFFAGTFASDDSENEVLNVEETIPPEPITDYLFMVNHHFRLEPLREMLREQRVVGLVALDSKEASFGILNGELFNPVETITSGIHGKSGKGGSSQRRYERERGMELKQFFHRIAEHAANAFLEKHQISVLVVGGPGPTKDDFLRGDYLHYELKNMFLGRFDTQSAGEEGVRQVLTKSSEAVKNMCLPEQKGIVQRLLADIGKQDGSATYGVDSVLKALQNGEVEVALVTDNTNMIEIVVMCKNCKLVRTKIVNTGNKVQTVREMISVPCERCSGVDYRMEEKDMIDVLEDAASLTNAKIEVLSAESEEKGKLAALGGFAALMRYGR